MEERKTLIGPKSNPSEEVNTAWICSFFNDLADAFNGKVAKDDSSEMRTLLTDESFHIKFFKEAASHVERMLFVKGTVP